MDSNPNNYDGLAGFLLGGPQLVFDRTQEDSEARMNLLISPTDADWIQIFEKFESLLRSDQTIGQILSTHFCASEARLFVSSDRPDVKAIQEDNRERYERLLRGRFRHVTPDLTLKLTMMYFGLPVAPMDFGMASMLGDLEKRKPEAPRFHIKPPLHFLTAHKERNWGDDNLRGREDAVGPLPVPAPESPFLYLRGGDADSDASSLDLERIQEDLQKEFEDGRLCRELSDAEDLEDSDPELIGKSVVHDRLDFAPDKELTVKDLSSDREDWMDLFGFQGSVPFVPGVWTTFTPALRRLLALFPEDKADFSLVHYDKENSQVVDEILDCLPLTPRSPSMLYISKLLGRERRDLKSTSAFFVKFQHEKSPTAWEPAAGRQPTTKVYRIRFAIPDALDEDDPLFAYCYVSIPRPGDANSPAGVLHAWGVDQYSPYFRTALEVLLGPRASGDDHHCFSQIGRASSSNFTAEPCTYGIASTSAHHLEILSDLGAREPAELRQTRINFPGIVFKLPGYHPPNKLAHYTFAKKHDPPRTSSFAPNQDFPAAAWTIRSMVKKFLAEDFELVRDVRIYPAASLVGSESKAKQSFHLLPLSETSASGSRSTESLDAVLKHWFKRHGPATILCPDWQEADTFMYGAWTTRGPEESAQCALPGFASSVKEFRARVSELLELTVSASDPLRCCDLGTRVLSIQGVRSDGSAMSLNGTIDLPRFFVWPHTHDDEWSRIRVMIPTRAAIVDVLDPSEWDWPSQVSRNNVWGPRYGHYAAQYKTSRKQVNDPFGTQEIRTPQAQRQRNELQKRYTPNVPPGETSRKKEVIVATPQTSKSVNASAFGSAQPHQSVWRGFNPSEAPLDPDGRRRAWASQPSIFDGYNLRTWPANSAIRIPATAPPLEHMLRISDRVPMVSKAVMTPTEQAELQRCFFEMRNLNLGRVTKCSYADCHFTFKHGEEGLLSHHLASTHLAQKCIWCDDPLYEHWSEQQRTAHLRHAHRDQLLETLNVTKGTITESTGHGTISIPLKRVSRHHVGRGLAMIPCISADSEPAVSRLKPVTQQFCDLCSRDYDQFTSDAERRYHDRNCRPDIHNHAKCEFCSTCGSHCWLTKADAAKSGMSSKGILQSCDHDRADPSGRHCRKCGFMLDALPADGQRRHALNCKGFDSIAGKFCCLCSMALMEGDTQEKREANAEHLRQCYANRLTGHRVEAGVPADLIVVEPIAASSAALSHAHGAREDAQDRGRARERPQEKRPENPVLDTEMLDERPLDEEPEHAAEKPAGTIAKQKKPVPEKPKTAVLKADKAQEPPVNPRLNATEQEKTKTTDAQKNRQKGKAKRGRRPARGDDDGDFVAESEDDDDDEEEEEEDVAEGQNDGAAPRKRKWKRRAVSPDWIQELGPEDPDFEPKADHYCSKCFRKAPTKPHKRDRSPLGVKIEIEMHYDKSRCCRIRKGIGSAENLPNRSGWIPSALMPKPLSDFKKKTLRRYPAYARTMYPLHEANRNGSYWRSDPNNDDNKQWWDIPWPAYQGKPPFPNWVAPDAPEQEAQAARRRQEFQLKGLPDPSYEYSTDDEVDEHADDVVPEEEPVSPTAQVAAGRKRKRVRTGKAKTAAAKTAAAKTAAAGTAVAAKTAAADAAVADADEGDEAGKKTKRAPKGKKTPAKRRKTG